MKQNFTQSVTEAIVIAQSVADPDPDRILSKVLIDNHRILATDGYRMMMFSMPIITGIKACVSVPRMTKPTTCSLDDRLLEIDTRKGKQAIALQSSDGYPAYEKIIPDFWRTQYAFTTEQRLELLEALQAFDKNTLVSIECAEHIVRFQVWHSVETHTKLKRIATLDFCMGGYGGLVDRTFFRVGYVVKALETITDGCRWNLNSNIGPACITGDRGLMHVTALLMPVNCG